MEDEQTFGRVMVYKASICLLGMHCLISYPQIRRRQQDSLVGRLFAVFLSPTPTSVPASSGAVAHSDTPDRGLSIACAVATVAFTEGPVTDEVRIGRRSKLRWSQLCSVA